MSLIKTTNNRKFHVKSFLKTFFLLLVFFLIFIFYFQYIKAYPIDFDGAYNLQVARNLYQENTFKSNQLQFDPNITTGYPVILPVYIAFKLFGLGFIQVKAVMFLFYLFFLYVTFLFIKNNTKNYLYSVISIVLLFLVHHFFISNIIDNVLSNLGEIPATAFFILSLILLSDYFKKNNYVPLALSGIVIGISIETKILMIFALFSYAFMFAFQLLQCQNRFKIFRDCIIFYISASLPILPFLFIKLLILGKTGFLETQQYFFTILVTHGSGLENISRIDSLKEHLNTIKDSIGINYLFFLLFVILILAQLIISARNKKYVLVNASVFGLIFSFWWFLISDSLWIRHYLIGILIIFSILPILLFEFIKYFHFKTMKNNFLLYSTILLLFTTIIYSDYDIIRNNFCLDCYKEKLNKQEKISNYITSELKNANIYYYGWWQAPGISFLSNKTFYNAERIEISQNSKNLLILTSLQHKLDIKSYNYGLNKCENIIYSDKAFNIICTIFPNTYSPKEHAYILSKSENVDLPQEINFTKKLSHNNIVQNGLYLSDFIVWSNKDSAMWIKKDPNSNYLVIEISVPFEELIPNEINIFINNELVRKKEITDNKLAIITIPFNSSLVKSADIFKLHFLSSKSIIPAMCGKSSDERSLSFVLYKIYQK